MTTGPRPFYMMMMRGKKKMNQHDAWHVLFFNPFFWEQTGKTGLELRRVCKSFRDGIPERLAIEAAFGRALIRKVDVYRLFPLSINDVVRLRSPLLFVDALRLAVRKTDGFDFCLAVMRERGCALSNSVGARRNQHRAKLLADLLAGGVSLQTTSELFEAAVSGRRRVDAAVVWRCVVFIFAADPMRTRDLDYDFILHRVKDTVGFWYKGINRDVRGIYEEISRARVSHALGNPISRMHHQHIAAKKFIFGVVEFRPWHGS
jgi:hypothetical protein